MASVLAAATTVEDELPSDVLVTLPKLSDFNTLVVPVPSLEQVLERFELLADFTRLPSFEGDLNELLILPRPFDLFGLVKRGLRLLKPPVLPEFTADFTISLIVLSILPLLHMVVLVFEESLVTQLVFVTLSGLLLFPSPVIVLRTPVLEKFTRILPIGNGLGRPLLPNVKLELVFITLVTVVVDVVTDAIVTVFVVIVLEDVAKATNPPVSGSESGDTDSNIELTASLISDTGTVSISSKYKFRAS